MPQAKPDRSTSLAKLSPPRLAAVFPRIRLFNKLDEARHCPVVWISAPGGSGKTTLVADYLKSQGLATNWYQVDAGDADVASFFYHLGLTVTRTAAQRRKPMPVLTPEYQAGLPVFTRNFFRKYFARVRQPGVLVLDNFQEVAQDAMLHELLNHAFEEIPEHINVIVVSRMDPPPGYARLLVNNQIKRLLWDDLKLTLEESLGIAHLRDDKKTLDSETILALHEHTQGWIAGLVLMLEQVRAQPNVTVQLPDAPSAVFDYFASEVLRRAEPETRDFLLKTSFLKKITVPMALELTGRADAETILRDLTRRNYFTIQHAGAHGSYEYHPLFQAFLVDRAAAEYSVQQIRELKQGSATLLVREGDVETAVALLLQTQDWPAVAGVILQHAQPLAAQGRLQTLSSWLQTLPPALTDEEPWILYWLGVSRMALDLQAAREYFERAYSGFKLKQDYMGVWLAWSGVVETYIYEWSNVAPLDHWIDEFYALMAQEHAPPTPELKGRVVVGIFSAMMYRQPGHPDLPKWIEQLEAMLRLGLDPSDVVNVGVQLLTYYSFWQGDQIRAQALLDFIEPIVKKATLSPLAAIAWQVSLSIAAWLYAENENSVTAARRGIALANEHGVHVFDFMLRIQESSALLTSGKFAEAEAALDQAQQFLNPTHSLNACYYEFMRGMLYILIDGKVHLKGQYFMRSLQLSRDAGCPWAIGQALGGAIGTSVLDKNFEDAEKYLSEAIGLVQVINCELVTFVIKFMESMHRDSQSDHVRSLEALRSLVEVMKRLGIANWGMWQHSYTARFFAQALANNIEVEYITALIKRRGVLPPQENSVPNNWPYPVKLYTLGRFNVVIRDEPLRFSGKTQKRPLDVLKILVALGGRDVAEDKITEHLWPDAEADDAVVALTAAVHRLRKLLGEDVIVRGQGRLSLDARYCWVDVWNFERSLSQLQDRLSQKDLDAVWSGIEQLFSFYTGDFLGSEPEQVWMIAHRERLRSRLLRVLEACGQSLSQAGRYVQAIAVYEKGLNVIPLAESLYRQLINLHLEQQHHSDALLVYQRCCKVVSAQLGLEPSPELQALRVKISAPQA